MQVTDISAEFRKTVNDGNYGNETATVRLSAQLAEKESAPSLAAYLLDQARGHVLHQLRSSDNENVVNALETREERALRRLREREESEERQRRWREEEEVRRQREAERDAKWQAEHSETAKLRNALAIAEQALRKGDGWTNGIEHQINVALGIDAVTAEDLDEDADGH